MRQGKHGRTENTVAVAVIDKTVEPRRLIVQPPLTPPAGHLLLRPPFTERTLPMHARTHADMLAPFTPSRVPASHSMTSRATTDASTSTVCVYFNCVIRCGVHLPYNRLYTVYCIRYILWSTIFTCIPANIYIYIFF